MPYEFRNPKYVSEGLIDCEVHLEDSGEWVPYTAAVDAESVENRDVYERALAGEAGPITPADPGPTPEEELQREREQMQCSNAQARLYLLDVGLFDTVVAALDNSTDRKVQQAWNHAQYFRRLSPTVTSMQAMLGWPDEQIDELFRGAVNIEA